MGLGHKTYLTDDRRRFYGGQVLQAPGKNLLVDFGHTRSEHVEIFLEVVLLQDGLPSFEACGLEEHFQLGFLLKSQVFE